MVLDLVTVTVSFVPTFSRRPLNSDPKLRLPFLAFLTVRFLNGQPPPLQRSTIRSPPLSRSTRTFLSSTNVGKLDHVITVLAGSSGYGASLPEQSWSILSPGMSTAPGWIAGLLSLQSAGGVLLSPSASPTGVVKVTSEPVALPSALVARTRTWSVLDGGRPCAAALTSVGLVAAGTVIGAVVEPYAVVV